MRAVIGALRSPAGARCWRWVGGTLLQSGAVSTPPLRVHPTTQATNAPAVLVPCTCTDADRFEYAVPRFEVEDGSRDRPRPSVSPE